MFKKTLLFDAVVMALCALPAVASAAQWTMEGSPLTGTSEIKLTGTVEYNSGENGGIHCGAVHVRLSADPGAAANITEFTCTDPVTYGPLNEVFGCTVEGHPTALDLPWNADAVGRGEAEISGIDIAYDMNPGCLLGEEMVVEDGSNPVIATANNAGAIGSVTLSGEVETNIGPSTVSGSFSVEPAGTYGIE